MRRLPPGFHLRFFVEVAVIISTSGVQMWDVLHQDGEIIVKSDDQLKKDLFIPRVSKCSNRRLPHAVAAPAMN